MVGCSVMGCKSNTLRKIEEISFHKFPNGSEIRKLWITATNKQNWDPALGSRVCNEHFNKEDFFNHGKRTFLKPNSVPVKLLHSKSKASGNPSCETCVAPMEVDSDVLMSVENLNVPCNSSPNVTPRTLKRKWKNQHKVSEKRLKRVKALREKSRRLNKKVADLSNIIPELKSKLLVSDENCELLASIETTNRDLLKKLLCPETSKRKYSPSLRKFALCLHFISPATYTFVRKTFNSCLPHTSTLRSWYKSIDENPGFTKESIECVKTSVPKLRVKTFIVL